MTRADLIDAVRSAMTHFGTTEESRRFRQGVATLTHEIAERMFARTSPASERAYINFLTACSHRRRTRTMKNIEIWQVVEGKRFQGGKVLKTFTSAVAHKCGGPATAALQAAHRLADRGIECHARRYYPDLHDSNGNRVGAWQVVP